MTKHFLVNPMAKSFVAACIVALRVTGIYRLLGVCELLYEMHSGSLLACLISIGKSAKRC